MVTRNDKRSSNLVLINLKPQALDVDDLKEKYKAVNFICLWQFSFQLLTFTNFHIKLLPTFNHFLIFFVYKNVFTCCNHLCTFS